MSAPSFTIEAIAKLRPCGEDFGRVKDLLPKRRKITAEQARAAGCTMDDLIWVSSELAHENKDIERRLRMWVADCGAHVLHIYENRDPTDMRPRDAIQAKRDYANGEIDAAAWAAAWAAEEEWQFDRLIYWLGDNPQDVTAFPDVREMAA